MAATALRCLLSSVRLQRSEERTIVLIHAYLLSGSKVWSCAVIIIEGFREEVVFTFFFSFKPLTRAPSLSMS
jgi:hypothetical protein